jgi:hypothetical protein
MKPNRGREPSPVTTFGANALRLAESSFLCVFADECCGSVRRTGGYLRCAQVRVNYTASGEASLNAAPPVRVCVDCLWCQVAPRVLKPNSAQPRPARYQRHAR